MRCVWLLNIKYNCFPFSEHYPCWLRWTYLQISAFQIWIWTIQVRGVISHWTFVTSLTNSWPFSSNDCDVANAIAKWIWAHLKFRIRLHCASATVIAYATVDFHGAIHISCGSRISHKRVQLPTWLRCMSKRKEVGPLGIRHCILCYCKHQRK